MPLTRGLAGTLIYMVVSPARSKVHCETAPKIGANKGKSP